MRGWALFQMPAGIFIAIDAAMIALVAGVVAGRCRGVDILENAARPKGAAPRPSMTAAPASPRYRRQVSLPCSPGNGTAALHATPHHAALAGWLLTTGSMPALVSWALLWGAKS
jgi:hypothetical protein